MDERDMTPPASEHDRSLYIWLDERLHQISQDVTMGHARLRDDMTKSFAQMFERMDKRDDDSSELKVKVAALETRYEMAKDIALRRIMLIGSLAGVIGALIVAGLRRLGL